MTGKEWILYVCGLLFVFVVLFVIKQVADIITQRGKIIFKRYVISFGIAGGCGIVFWYFLKMENEVAMILLLIPLAIFLLYPFVSSIRNFGIVKGLCIISIQVVASVMILAIMYVSLVMGVLFFALLMGSSMRYDGKLIKIISVGREEISFIMRYNDYTYYDNDGNTYILDDSGKYFIRQEDAKYFELY